jgi:hypothetical protein
MDMKRLLKMIVENPFQGLNELAFIIMVLDFTWSQLFKHLGMKKL